MAWEYDAYSDFIRVTTTSSMTDNDCLFVSLWCYPTNLTQSPYIWTQGFGTYLVTDNGDGMDFIISGATTSGQYAIDYILSTNQWYFIAVYFNPEDTGPVDLIRVWVGTPDAAPVMYTPTQTQARVGAINNADTSFNIGNTDDATLGFQGLIDEVTRLWIGTVNRCCFSTQDASGTLASGEIDNIEKRIVLPAYYGQLNYQFLGGNTPYNTATNFDYINLRSTIPTDRNWCSTLIVSPRTVTISGPTWNAARPPFVHNDHFPLRNPSFNRRI